MLAETRFQIGIEGNVASAVAITTTTNHLIAFQLVVLKHMRVRDAHLMIQNSIKMKMCGISPAPPPVDVYGSD